MTSTSGESTPLLSRRLSYPTGKLGTRHMQMFLVFLGIAIAYGMRVCMSITIVAMTDAKSANPNFPEFDWSPKQSSLVLSSFFWGYVLTQIPSGYLVTSRGAQKLFSYGIFVSSVLSLLTPTMAIQFDWIPMIICRVVTGLSQGCMFPCVQTLLSRWVPPGERARLGAFVMNAGIFGTVITMPISGTLSTSRFGWPSVFYIFGMCGIVWSIVFFFMGADEPSEHPTICPDEQRYIDGSLGRLDKTSTSERPKIPWRAILTSGPMWSLLIAHCGSNWGFYMLLTEMPTYMNNILNFDVSKSGLVSTLPYMANWLLMFPIAWLSDFSLRKGVSVSRVRKISNTVGMFIPGLALLAMCLVKTNDTVIFVLILTIATGFSVGTACGYQINHIDLSPAFAGTLMSITNTAGNMFGFIAPLVCGVVIDTPTDVSQWHIIFYITAFVYFSTNIVFVYYGKADIQSWSEPNFANSQSRPRVSRLSIVYDPTSVVIVETLKP